jgi:two-component system LytT family response regulator
MAIRTLIADDEVLARGKLRQLLSAEPDVEIAGEASTALETIERVRTAAPQLLFLDVQMPGMTGLDLVSALTEYDDVLMPQIIFTTAYDQYALRAFDIQAADFLLKPFTEQRFRSALERARSQIYLMGRSADLEQERDRPYATRIVFKSRGRILFLPLSDIRWIGAEENYVRICTGAETHLLRETMTSIEKRLNPELFLRVHRSTIVNLEYVKEIRTESRGDFIVQLKSGQKVAMSRSYHARISEVLSNASSVDTARLPFRPA